MNVACSSCPAKYAVPDEKVRGKKVRITCKRCGTAIIVDGTAEGLGAAAPSAPAPAPAPAPAAAAAPAPAAKAAPKAERVRHKTMVGGLQAAANSAPGAPGVKSGSAAKVTAPAAGAAPVAPRAGRIERTEPALAARSGSTAKTPEPRWTVAVTEDDHRDLTVAEIAGLYADRVIDSETYVWRDGMADWLTPLEIPEIAAALSAQGLSGADDAHDPGRASGGWHEPGRWDAPADAGAFSDEVTVAMDGDRARLLVEAASSMTASPAPPPPSPPGAEPPDTAFDPTPALQTSGFTAEAAPYSPAARAVLANERRSIDNLLDALPTPAVGSREAEGASFSSVALPLVSPKSDAPTAPLPEAAPVAPATSTAATPASASVPRAAVTGARSARGDLFSKEAQASREASPRARLPSITPDVAPPPRGRMPSVADEPPRAKLPSVTGDPEPKPRARISSNPPPPEPQQGTLTGARNESSVLFSLDALAGKNAPKARSPRKSEEDLLMGGSAASGGAPPSVANLQNAALFSNMTMAVPDFAAPVAPSATEHSKPAAAEAVSVPKKSSGGVWAFVALALIGGGAAAYFLLYAKDTKAPEPPAVTSAPAIAETSPPPPEPTAPPADSAAAAGSAVPAEAASASAAPAASGTPSASAAATPGGAVPTAAPAAPGIAKPAAPAALKPPGEPAAAAVPKPAAPAPADKPAVPAAAAEPAVAEGPPFDRDAASAALSAAASAAVAQCSSLEGTHGSGKVTVTFVNSGRATNALVSGDFAGSALGGCVAKIFRSSKIPAFGGEVVKVTKSLQIP